MIRVFRSVRDKVKPSISIRGISTSSTATKFKSKPALFAMTALGVSGGILCFKKITADQKKLTQKPELTLNETKLDLLFQGMNSNLKEVLKEYGFNEKQQKGFLLFCLTQYNVDVNKMKFSDLLSANEWLLSLACSADKARLGTSAYSYDENEVLALKSAELLGMLNVVKPDHNDQLPFDAIVFDTAWNWDLMEDIAKSVRSGRTPDTIYCVAPETEKNNKYIETDFSWKKAVALSNRFNESTQIIPHTKVDRIFYHDSKDATQGRVMRMAEAIANHPPLSKKKIVIYMWSDDAIWQFEIIKNALKKTNPDLKVCLNTTVKSDNYYFNYAKKLSDMITEKYPAIKEKLQKPETVKSPTTLPVFGKPIGQLC